MSVDPKIQREIDEIFPQEGEIRKILLESTETRRKAVEAWEILVNSATGTEKISSGQMESLKLFLAYVIGKPVDRIERVVLQEDILRAIAACCARVGMSESEAEAFSIALVSELER